MKKLILFILLFIGLSNTSWLQPPNDYCSTAQSITPDGTCYGGTTVGADDSWISSVACQGGGTHPDVWYSFTATNTQLDYIVTPSAPWVGDIEFILVEATGGPCSGLVLAGSHCGAGPISGSITGIQVGALYYFTISNASGGTPGPFQVCVNNVAAPISPGQDCGNAAILCNGNPFSQGVFVGVGVVENISTNTCFGANERQSKWYKFTAGCSGTFGFNIIPNNLADDYDFILWNTTAGCYTAGSTMGVPMACNWSGTTGSTGINYYGNIGLIEPNPCSAAGAIDCVAGGGPNAGCQPCTYYNSTAGNYNPVNLVAGETYTLLIDNFSASGSGFSIDFGGTAVMGPDAHFTSSPTGCNSYSFTKTCQIPNGSYTFNWAFGDGNFSSLQNPSHTYVTPGSYTVTLEATDALGCVAAYSINITVGFPDASAGSDQTLSCASPQVVLNGSSATAPVSFAWAGPGIVSGGTTATPTVNAPGVYTITVTNTSNGCTATSTVTVTSSIDPPLASAGTPQTLTCTTTSVVLNGSGSASGGGPFWTEDFGIGCNQNQVASSYTGPNGAWNITLTGANGSHANQFFVSATEAGMGAGNCGDGCLGNPGLTNRTLHIANVANSSIACFFCPTGDCGAAYDASNPNGFMASFCGPLGRSPLSDRRAESPVINCSGKSTITLSFNYMEGGSGLNDNATLWYFDGAVWAQLSDMAKTPTTCSPQGLWTAYSFPLPASANNNPNVRIGFRWVNNTDDAGSDPSFAVDDIVLSSPASPVTYSWTGPGIVSGGTTATPTVNAAGTYTITVTNPANGCTATSSVLVSSNTTPPTANAGAPQTLTCASSSVVLDGSASSAGVNFTYNWAGPGIVSGGTTTTPTVNAAGTYTITVTNTSNGCTATSSVVVNTDIATPTANAGAPQTLTCASSSVVLDGSASSAGVNFTYNWTGPGIVSGGTTTTPTVNAAGTYTITVTNTSNGCTATSSVVVNTDIATPTANAGAPQTLTCASSSVVLDGSASSVGVNFTYNWAGPGIVSGGTTTAPTVNAAGTYTITVTNTSNGCMATSSVVVNTDIATPTANAGAPQTLTCASSSVVLDGSASSAGVNFTYNWAGPGIVSGGTTTAPTVNAAGTYTITVTNTSNGCTATSSVVVNTDIATPTANAGAPQTLTCASSSVVLDGSASSAGVNFTYNWAGPGIVSGGTTTTPTVNAAGTYTITVTNTSNGCTATSSVVVNSDPTLPTANAGSPQTLTCASSSVVLDGSASSAGVNFTYNWAGPGIVSGGTTTTPTVNAAGTYTITVTNTSNGCTATSSVVVNSDIATPTANAGAPQTLTCASSSVVLDGSASSVGVNFTYNWAGPGIVSGGTTTAPTVNAAGTYTITVTNTSNGCTSSSQVTVSITVSTPDASAGSDLLLPCNTSSIFIVGSSITPGVNYAWTTIGGNILSGATQSNVEINAPGIYILTVTNPANSCTNTDTMLVLLPALPTVTALEQTSVSCYGLSDGVAEATGAGGLAPYIYYWSDGSSNVSIQTSAGIYTVTLTDDNGCSATATVQIMQPTQLYLSLVDTVSPDCGSFNGSIEIVAMGGTPNYTYTWNNSTTTGAILSGISEGSYTGYVTDANNCIDSMTIVLTCKELPLFIPQLLSPNGDGKNDVWVILNLDNYPNNLVKIFNRWGNQVYISNPYLNDWDGKSNAALSIGAGILPAGTYFYVIDLHGDGANILSGYLELQP